VQNDEKTFIAWERASRDTIDVKRCYIDIAGDLATGVLLSQIIFWFLPNKKGAKKTRIYREGRRWIAKTRKEFWEECRVSERQCDRGLKVLEEKGIINRKIWKFYGDPTAHISVNFEKLKTLVDEWAANHPDEDDDEFRLPPNAGNDSDKTQVTNAANGGEPYTEITAENTTEILNTSDSDSKANGETKTLSEMTEEEYVSVKNRLQRAATQLFGTCDSPNSPVWSKVKEKYKYSNEREVEAAFYEWAGDGWETDSPIQAFLNNESSSPRAVKEVTASGNEARQRAHDLSVMVAAYTVGKSDTVIAFNERQQKNLVPACKKHDTALLFAAFKRYWDGLPDKKAEQFAAKNFSEMAEALAAAEIVQQEAIRKRDADIAAMEKASREAAEQVERELQEQREREARDAENDEPLEF
jgi:hypothetical protein